LAPKDGNQVRAQDRGLTTPEPGKRKKKKKNRLYGLSTAYQKNGHSIRPLISMLKAADL
jgi:hypothetical protein